MKSSKSEIQAKYHKIPTIHFEDQKLTSFSGILVFQLLFKRLELKERLKKCFANLKASPIFGRHLVVLLLVVHLLLGFRRMREVDYYRDDPLVLRLMGLRRLPDVSTISRAISQVQQDDVEILTPQKDVSPTQEKSSGQTSDTNQINWNEADGYIGEFVTVCGPVVSAYFATSTNGQPTFLNIGKEYPDPERFTALIWGRDLENFPFNPDEYYFGKTICIQGFVEEYKGTLEIEVTDPEQIKIK